MGEFPLDDWQWVLDTNLRSVVLGCHTFAGWLRENPAGSRVINVASLAAFAALPSMGAYNVANGELQVELDFGQEMVRRGLLASGGRRLDRLAGWQNELGVAVLPLSTAEDPVLQLQRLLGGLASPRRVER